MLTVIVILAALNVLAFVARASVRTASSGAESLSASATLDRRPKICPDYRRAVRFYQRHYAAWRAKMGAGHTSTRGDLPPCPRYLAKRWKRKAYLARVRYYEWREYHYAWWKWMPAKHQRVAACETGHQGGTGPGGSRWDWDSRQFDAYGRFLGGYVSAFGIYGPGYDDDAHRIGNLGWDETKDKLGRYPTPREQMQAADSHRAAHGGWSGWGCRGA